MNNNHPLISKSSYLSGLQCHKFLWYKFNAKNEIPEYDAGTQAIFDQGHLVGEYAKKMFPDGIEINTEYYEIEKTIEESQRALALRKPIFEAGFRYKDAFSRPDILNPVGNDAWDIIEVKSSTEVKDVNLNDLAVQWYIYEGSGLRIHSCSICHINNKYVRMGEIEPRKLFAIEDVTAKVKILLPDVENDLKQMQKTISLLKCPEIKIGPHCDVPYECPLKEKCWAFLPAHNIFTLASIQTKKCSTLLDQSITAIDKLPSDFHLSEKQKIQVKVVTTGKTHIDKEGICDFLKCLQYPLYYLDFETLGTAIPSYDLSKPYQQVPFQYSLHVVNSPNAKPEHHEFLADDTKDPRPEILKNLKQLLGDKGSIVAYFAGFEKARLKECIEAYPEYEGWYKAILVRFIDLYSPFGNFSYYHPDQLGSASLKAVLPALTGKGYESMEIKEGGSASREFMRVTFGDVDMFERQHVRDELLKYCGLDTMAMVWIVDKLKEIAS